MFRTLRRPSPALAIALAALFVALSGTAVAATVVPLAKRALTADKAKIADNSKKLEGKTSAQLLAAANAAAQSAASSAAQQPGPASTVAGLVTIKSVSAGTLGPGGGGEFNATCDAGQKAVGGGYSSTGLVVAIDDWPANDTTWRVFLANLSSSSSASVSVYAVCMK